MSIADMTTSYLNQLIPPNVELERGPLRLISHDFGDIYFSVESGLDEADLVFIDGNDLIPRMKAHQHKPHGGIMPFVIAETGFGTGLNFLAVLRAWKRQWPISGRQPGADAPRLHYISTEIAPLPPALIAEVLTAIPEVAVDAKMMVEDLPPIWPGRHRRHFCDGQVTLDLLYGDCLHMLAQSRFQADAWFLDGFAPAKNAAMWQDDLYGQIARLSAPDATVASFTAAGDVRRGLGAAGFEVERREGFGHKRHRITGKRISGRCPEQKGQIPISQTMESRAKENPAASITPPITATDQVVVIGAGIAGASVAAGLMRYGITPLVIGRGDGPHDGASGNIAAVQIPHLMAMESLPSHLSMAAYGYARWLARNLGANLNDGAVIYGWNDRETIRQGKILAQGLSRTMLYGGDGDAMRDVTGMDAGLDGLIFPEGGVVDPRKFTQSLLAGAATRFGAVVTKLTKGRSKDGCEGGGGWTITLDDGGVIDADHVVLAGGSGLAALTEGWLDPILPFQVTAGRVSHLPPDSLADCQADSFPDSLPNNLVDKTSDMPALSFGGYLARSGDGTIALGATFDNDINDEMGIDHMMHECNLAMLPHGLRRYFPEATAAQTATWGGRLSYRIAAQDRQPVAGQIGDGLYILTALGARGMVTGPILGGHVAAEICGAPSPLDIGMAAVVNPYRFSAKAGL